MGISLCPSCEREAEYERLRGGWRVCTRCWIAYALDADGKVVAWSPTNKSRPPKPRK